MTYSLQHVVLIWNMVIHPISFKINSKRISCKKGNIQIKTLKFNNLFYSRLQK